MNRPQTSPSPSRATSRVVTARLPAAAWGWTSKTIKQDFQTLSPLLALSRITCASYNSRYKSVGRAQNIKTLPRVGPLKGAISACRGIDHWVLDMWVSHSHLTCNLLLDLLLLLLYPQVHLQLLLHILIGLWSLPLSLCS